LSDGRTEKLTVGVIQVKKSFVEVRTHWRYGTFRLYPKTLNEIQGGAYGGGLAPPAWQFFRILPKKSA